MTDGTFVNRWTFLMSGGKNAHCDVPRVHVRRRWGRARSGVVDRSREWEFAGRRRAPPARKARPDRPENAARLARRERRRDRSREEILEAARRIVLRNGVAATTLDAVAREVGVTKTALYYYFPSKDALLFELMFAALDRHARAVDAAVEEARDGADALAALIRGSVKAYAPRLEDFRLAFLQSQLAGPDRSVSTRSNSRASGR